MLSSCTFSAAIVHLAVPFIIHIIITELLSEQIINCFGIIFVGGSSIGYKTNAYRVLEKKTKLNRTLERTRCR